MSLILGMNLLRKVYLASDTRVTLKGPQGLWMVTDDLIKSVTFDSKVSCIAAGHASLASHVLRRLKQLTGRDGYFSDLMRIIEKDLEQIVIEHVNLTGLENQHAALIMAGFDSGLGKEVNSARLGEVMSAPVRKMEGRIVNQSVDIALREALSNAIAQHKQLESDHILNVKVPSSKMITVEVNTYRKTTERYKINTVNCYEYAVYSPGSASKANSTPGMKLSVPSELIGDLEFRNQGGQKEEDILRHDLEMLMTFIQESANRYQFTSVGGHIFVQCVTPAGAIFSTGTIFKYQHGKVTDTGEMFVKENKLAYRMQDGREGFYQYLEDYGLKSHLEII